MQIAENWLNDIPQQFKGKKNIEVLFKAFAKQLEEVNQVLLDVNEKTTLAKAEGINLDRLGNILSMTRKDATKIIRQKTEYEMSDDLYRKCLKYQILKETGSCTYEEIMGATADLWNVDEVKYTEKASEPATIRLILGSYEMDSVDPLVGKVMAFKSAGVRLVYEMVYNTTIKEMLDFAVKRVSIYTFIREWPCWDYRKLDGTWLIDGSYDFSNYLGSLPVAIRMAPIQIIHHSHPDYVWYLDGTKIIDGYWYLSGEIYEQMTVYINGENVDGDVTSAFRTVNEIDFDVRTAKATKKIEPVEEETEEEN